MIQLIRRQALAKYFYASKADTMSVIILLLVASLSVALVFLGAFLWSVHNKQYDDDYSPPRRILFDDSPTLTNEDNIKLN